MRKVVEGSLRRTPKVIGFPGVKISRSVRDHRTLLWIDDYLPALAAYKKLFQSFGYRVFTAPNGRLGLELLERHAADLVVVDYEMPDMDGAQVATEIRRRDRHVPIIMFSACTSVPGRVRHLVDAFCDKAGPIPALMGAVESALSHSSAA